MLKTLGAQVKQYRWVTFITPVFSALEAVADMFLPMLMSQIIDKGVKVGGQAGMQAVLHYGAIMVAVAIGALVCGILAGVFFLNKGYTLKRSYALTKPEGGVFVILTLVVFALLLLAPAFIHFSEAGAGPGALHAPILISLAAGLIVGALAQRTRLCMVGGVRDLVLFKETKLILGFAAILVGALVCNLILTGATGTSYFHLGFADQPVAHTDGLWNFLGMLLVGFACVLLGGCPLRQLILAGEGNSDSAITVLGLLAGAAFCHNFGLASSGNGPTANGKIAVVIGIAVALVVACVNTFRKENTK